eukprot:scaffold166_cov340-Pavlova_lutheri.AAC.1
MPLLNGCLLSWQSKLQPIVSTSTTEAEYQSASSAVKEAIRWSLTVKIKHASRYWRTITACIKILENNHSMQKTKHTDVAHHFVRERVMLGDVMSRYCESAEMVADY